MRHERTDFALVVLYLWIVLEFIPLPWIPVFNLGPENLIVGLAFLFLLLNPSRFASLDRRVLVIIAVLVFYSLLELAVNIVQGEGVRGPISKFKPILFLVYMVIICSSTSRFLKIVKFFLFMTVISVCFGALVYFFGEPFTSIRAWLNQSTATTVFDKIYIGKGSQLTGLYCPPHLFGYLMAATPILCLAVYFERREMILLVYLAICFVGLLLNAERAALLMNAVVFCYLVLRSKSKSLAIVAVMACLAGALIVHHVSTLQTSVLIAEHGKSYVAGTLAKRLDESSGREFVDRFKWQLHGIRTVLRHPWIGATREEYEEVVGSATRSSRFSSGGSKPMASHNHYVNVGLTTGVSGWILLGILAWFALRVFRTTSRLGTPDKPLFLTATGIRLAFVAVTGTALFHNGGIFSGELASVSILALLLTFYTLQHRATYATRR